MTTPTERNIVDIDCPRCGEPCDQTELHQVEGKTYTDAARMFRSQGCGILFEGIACHGAADDARLAILREMADLLGDDVDGYAAMCEDLDLIGGF
jgi:hypothetical protein